VRGLLGLSGFFEDCFSPGMSTSTEVLVPVLALQSKYQNKY
jgi:hypothetical protein